MKNVLDNKKFRKQFLPDKKTIFSQINKEKKITKLYLVTLIYLKSSVPIFKMLSDQIISSQINLI